MGNENGRSRSDSVSAAQGFWRRKDFGGTGGGAGGGPGGKKAGGGAGQGISGGVVCSLSVRLSVAGRTSPSCLGRLRRNFRWWSGSWSGTFISGTGLIGQGTGEKRAGNSNFGRFAPKKGCCFGQFFGIVWLAGGAPCNLVVPGGHWVVPGGPRVLPGGCLVVIGHKLKVLESLVKGVFWPPGGKRGGLGGILPPILGRTGPGACRGGFGGILPPL